MKTTLLIFTYIFFILFLTGACVPGSATKENRNRIAELERQLDLTHEENIKLLENIDNKNTEIEACKTINRNLTENLQKLSGQSQKLKEDIDKQKSVLQLQDQVIKLLDDTKQSIESSLKDQISALGIEITQSEDQLKVVLLDQIIFDSGSVEIKKEGKKMLLALAEALRKNNTNQIVVNGHTDNIPPGPSLRRRFPSNWELSAARAASVVRFLQNEGNLDPRQLSLKAFGPFAPVASNQTEEGRMKNRRIEIILDQP
ncbi:MAG: OmpA family protein [Deltaproteobacteria bacterium]|nr:OmpA family protein [Deltaproteobacteria bacterium]